MRRAGVRTSVGGQQPAADIQPRRILPAPGASLTVGDIFGEWRPSGSIDGMGIFAVVWYRNGRTYWAALHDFARHDREQLIQMCSGLDRDASGGVSKSMGRH